MQFSVRLEKVTFIRDVASVRWGRWVKKSLIFLEGKCLVEKTLFPVTSYNLIRAIEGLLEPTLPFKGP